MRPSQSAGCVSCPRGRLALQERLLAGLSQLRGSICRIQMETYVAAKLIKWMRTSPCDAQLFYYRTRSGLDIDVLLQGPHGLLGLGRKRVASQARACPQALLEACTKQPRR